MADVVWILLEKFTMILFFLDDGLVGKIINDCKVIGGMKDIQVLREKYSNIFIAIGNNRLRETLQPLMQMKGLLY